MTLRPFLTLFLLTINSLLSMEIDKVDPNNSDLISHIKSVHFNMIIPEKSNVLPETLLEKETYLEEVWRQRLEDLTKNDSSLIFVHQDSDPLCALFLYPSKLVSSGRQPEDVLVNVGLVLLTNDKSKIPEAINAITQYEIQNYPTYSFISYMPKDFQPFKEIFDSQNYEEVDLRGYVLEPVNNLDRFPVDKFNWFMRPSEQ